SANGAVGSDGDDIGEVRSGASVVPRVAISLLLTANGPECRAVGHGVDGVVLPRGTDQHVNSGLLDGATQAVVQRHRRLPLQRLGGARDVGLAALWVVDGQCLVDDLRL